MDKVLVMFSGGSDSLLTAGKVIEEGYQSVLVHYVNGFNYGSGTVLHNVKKLEERYGSDKVINWGIGNTSGYFVALKSIYDQMAPKGIIEKYPNLAYAQANCLACRTAMYIFSILICQKEGISKIAEGARKSQLFAIEQEPMLNRYRKLINEYGIDLLTPVIDLDNDFDRKIELSIRQINQDSWEPKCLLGVPMERPLNEEEINDAARFYDEQLLGPTKKLIKSSDKIPLDNTGNIYYGL